MSERNNDFTFRDGVSLKEYFESRLQSIQESIIVARESFDKRLDEYKVSMEGKFASVNEFRATLSDQATRFVTKIELGSISSSVQELKESRAELRGKASQQSVNISYIIALIGLILSLMNFFLKR